MNFLPLRMLMFLVCLGSTLTVLANDSGLPRLGPAPQFWLTTQDKALLKLSDLRGKVVAVTFIFTTCQDTCPILTAKLVGVQKKLSPDIDPNVAFVAITLTPDHDTPEVLKAYAETHRADLSRWSFLTGDESKIHQLAKLFGVFVKRKPSDDEVDHGFLTSIIDRSGIIRVQYMGTRFEPNELLADLEALVAETAAP